MMNRILAQLRTDDWTLATTGWVIILLSLLFPSLVPCMPDEILSPSDILQAIYLMFFILALVYLAYYQTARSVKGIASSFVVLYTLSIISSQLASFDTMKEYGFESVFFSVIIGLLISNLASVPQWLRPAIQSEFYIKVGIVCLGTTVLFDQMAQYGLLGIVQSLVVVFSVWLFAFKMSARFGVDAEMGTMLASSVSICGVSAAIATCGVIRGDNKKLSYVISLVMVCAIPMMYIMPWLAAALGLDAYVAGAWIGGTIDTTSAVAASGSMVGGVAEQTAIIVKSAQNLLLGVAAFIISLMWSYRGAGSAGERPTLKLLWSQFPKFVVGFIAASLLFSFAIDNDTAKAVGKITGSMSTTLFSLAFICIGLETKFSDLARRENRKPIKTFLVAQGFNVVLTLVVSYLVFGLLRQLFV